MHDDGGTTAVFGVTIGLDRNLVCTGSSLSSLEEAVIGSECSFSVSFVARSSFTESVD
jgi:hypothetical protein